MDEPISTRGFSPPRSAQALSRRRARALELIATGALAASLIIAATAVSLGKRSLARSDERPAAPIHVYTPL